VPSADVPVGRHGAVNGARERLQTRSVALGRLRIGSLDNIGEAIAVAEGEAYK